MSNPESISELAKKYLSEKGQGDIEILLSCEKTRSAQLYVLGAIDSLWKKKEISDSEAAEAYQKLGVDPETASKVRQSCSDCWS